MELVPSIVSEFSMPNTYLVVGAALDQVPVWSWQAARWDCALQCGGPDIISSKVSSHVIAGTERNYIKWTKRRQLSDCPIIPATSPSSLPTVQFDCIFPITVVASNSHSTRPPGRPSSRPVGCDIRGTRTMSTQWRHEAGGRTL